MTYSFSAQKKGLMVRRLLRQEGIPVNVSEILHAALKPSAPGAKSEIAQHYANTFNNVDRFDTYLGHVSYPYKVESAEKVILIHLLRMTVVNALALYNELCHEYKKADRCLKTKDFVEIVSKKLMVKK
jgi:hypothetical protein